MGGCWHLMGSAFSRDREPALELREQRSPGQLGLSPAARRVRPGREGLRDSLWLPPGRGLRLLPPCSGTLGPARIQSAPLRKLDLRSPCEARMAGF
ncbi:hypothetical protein DV515_00016130 [Chloebia gouldiae]|uniref:Uncharacterized protein n=1 Tax=Chloebia gouldiae TaxID=44316 RepID=A0A3L8RT76_CHLGU|nr:hypothetical protein DV515_00016130 [Chloebia gouldiae]